MAEHTKNKYSISNVYNDFFSECEKIMKTASGELCCLAIDIEHFKLFNGIFGYDAGDRLLETISAELKTMSKTRRCAWAHFGQDDFAVFMEYDRTVIDALYAKIQSLVTGMTNSVGFMPAIGVYRLTADSDINIGIYDRAVAVLTAAKKLRSNKIVEHTEADAHREQGENEVLLKLNKALANGEITFFLQPQYNMATNKIVGAEVLARWIEKDGHIIPPGVFIPSLENSGFIADFDKHIWEMACMWIRTLLDSGITPVPISINVSQVDILTVDVVEIVSHLMQQYEIPANFLKVEITESSYAEETEKVQPLVATLRDKGIVTLLDDFGSGYSSLNMLENITADVLKLDMAFIKERNLNSHKGITIVESIINMAKMMGLPTIIEGVETVGQVKFLKSLGCRYAQGYFYCKPMPIKDFEVLLRDEKNLDRSGFRCKMNEQVHVREFLDENTFTDTMLNNLLGAVAFYALERGDLTITRYNEQFYQAIADDAMNSRQEAIQNYIVQEDWPSLYRALDDAYTHPATGGTCEIRFYKSDNSVFWFRMHFFYLRSEYSKKIFYGQVEDVTAIREQSIQFFEVLRQQADIAMLINLDQNTIQYITGDNTFSKIGLPSIDLSISLQRTAQNRIRADEDKQKFLNFYSAERLRDVYHRAIYHEKITIDFRLFEDYIPVEFTMYCIRGSKDQDLLVYAFAKAKSSKE